MQQLFGAPIIGLTGSPAQIDQVKKQYGIYAQPMPHAAMGQSIAHTATVLLFDREREILRNHLGRRVRQLGCRRTERTDVVVSRYRPDPQLLTLGPDFYDPVEPAKFPQCIPRFLNRRWAERVGLELEEDEWARRFCRFEPLPDNLPQPLALRYHGHQFRVYNPEIGDGRGFTFAQLRDEEGSLLDLGTKGSGQTPYSRHADGRLTLKGGVREVLATEMLEALCVNTSKTFALFETGEPLERGDEPSPTRSSVLTRLSHGHIRIGTFQRLAFFGQADNITKLVRYCLENLY